MVLSKLVSGILSGCGVLVFAASAMAQTPPPTIPESSGACSFAAVRGVSCSASFHTCTVTKPPGAEDPTTSACPLNLTVKCRGRTTFSGYYTPSYSSGRVVLAGIPNGTYNVSPTLVLTGLRKLPARLPASLNVSGSTRRGTCTIRPVAASPGPGPAPAPAPKPPTTEPNPAPAPAPAPAPGFEDEFNSGEGMNMDMNLDLSSEEMEAIGE